MKENHSYWQKRVSSFKSALTPLRRTMKWVGYQGMRALFSNYTFGLFLKKQNFVQKLKAQIIPPGSGKLAIEIAGIELFYMWSNGSDSIASRMYFFGYESFEKSSIDTFIGLLKNSRSVIDIGANTGIYSLIASRHDPMRRVYSVEPLKNVHRFLERNIRINNFINVVPLNFGLTENPKIKEATFFIPVGITLPTGASLKKYNWERIKEIKIQLTTLDLMVEELDISDIDIIKIDAETLEPEILRGGITVLKEHRPTILCEILHQEAANKIEDLLKPLDYSFYQILENTLERQLTLEHDPSGVNINYLLAPSEKTDIPVL